MRSGASLDLRRPHRARLPGPTCAEVIFHSCEADIAKRVIVEVDRRAARAGTYAPAEPVKLSSNQVCHSRAPSFAGAQPRVRAAGARLGRARVPDREDSCDSVPARGNRRSPPPRQQRAGGILAGRRANDRYGARVRVLALPAERPVSLRVIGRCGRLPNTDRARCSGRQGSGASDKPGGRRPRGGTRCWLGRSMGI